jgi:predicted nucleotidyltransferase
MSRPEILKVTPKTLEKFCKRYSVRRLALFGSVLRNYFGPESDIDILVVFEPGAKVSFMTLGRMQRELSVIFKRKVDLVPQEGLKPAIREAVITSSQEVYAA